MDHRMSSRQKLPYQAATVYWFDDAPWGGCRVPKSWKIYYKDAQGQWQPVTGVDKYGVVKGAGNTVNFDPGENQISKTGNHPAGQKCSRCL